MTLRRAGRRGRPQRPRVAGRWAWAPGDTRRRAAAQQRRLLAAYFAAIQTGLYMVPGQLAPRRRRDRLHPRATAGPRRSSPTSGSPGQRVRGGGRWPGSPDARFAVGTCRVPAAGRAGRRRVGPRPADRTHGRADGLHVGHLRAAQGRAPPADRRRPGRTCPPMATWFFGIFGLEPFDGHVHLCGSPLYHTAVLNFAAISVQLGHPVVLMDRWDAGGDAAAHRAAPGDPQPHGADPVPPAARPAGGGPQAAYDLSSMRCMIHSAAPCPPEVKRRMLDWWGRWWSSTTRRPRAAAR